MVDGVVYAGRKYVPKLARGHANGRVNQMTKLRYVVLLNADDSRRDRGVTSANCGCLRQSQG